MIEPFKSQVAVERFALLAGGFITCPFLHTVPASPVHAVLARALAKQHDIISRIIFDVFGRESIDRVIITRK